MLVVRRISFPAVRHEYIGQWAAALLNPVMVGFLRKYRGIKAEAVAKAMVNIAVQGKKGIFTYLSDQIQTLSEQ